MTLSPLELLQRTEFFSGLEPSTVADLGGAIRLRQVPAGEVLIEQDASEDALYLLRHGRLEAVHTDEQGGRRIVGEIVAGEMFGEMAMFSAERRATSVRALRDSEVIELPRTAFDRLATAHPELLRRLAALLARRLRAANRTNNARVYGTVALVPHNADTDPVAFAESLRAALAPYREARVVPPEAVPGGIAGTARSLRERVLPWLTGLEADGCTLLLVTRPGASEWNRLVLAQADLVLVLAHGTDDPRAGPVEAALPPELPAPRELVLLHAPGTTPTGTLAWLSAGRFRGHHHLVRGDAKDLGRLARWLTGRSLGVAFGGGGARGFAHIGMMRAFIEEGIEIDRVGGTSMGSIMAAEVALGWSWQAMLERTRTAFRRDPLKRDNTLPLASLITCRRVVKLFQELFGEARAEDAWLPYFAILCNLSRAEPMVRRHGLYWQIVRASSALPGLGPPVIENGDFIVDGAIFNNVPADVLLDESAGPVIAINVSPRENIHTVLPDNYQMSGWRLLWDRLRGRPGAAEYPSMLFLLQRTVLLNTVAASERLGPRASLYLHPELERFDMFGWHRINEIAEVGYWSGRSPIAAWAGKREPVSAPSQASEQAPVENRRLA